MIPDLDDPDWAEAFRAAAAPFAREDIAEPVVLCEGAPHRASWLGIFRLSDGRYAFVRATCCGAGWTCHAGGDAAVGERLDDLLRCHLTDAERRRIEA